MRLHLSQHHILLVIIAIIIFFIGWSTGSSLAYRNGYNAAHHLFYEQKIEQDFSEFTPLTRNFIDNTTTLQSELLASLSNQADIDLARLLKTYLTHSWQICKTYQQEAQKPQAELIDLCAAHTDHSKKTLESLITWQQENGVR